MASCLKTHSRLCLTCSVCSINNAGYPTATLTPSCVTGGTHSLQHLARCAVMLINERDDVSYRRSVGRYLVCWTYLGSRLVLWSWGCCADLASSFLPPHAATLVCCITRVTYALAGSMRRVLSLPLNCRVHGSLFLPHH